MISAGFGFTHPGNAINEMANKRPGIGALRIILGEYLSSVIDLDLQHFLSDVDFELGLLGLFVPRDVAVKFGDRCLLRGDDGRLMLNERNATEGRRTARYGQSELKAYHLAAP